MLSGTGSDGALGLKAIKACGGFAIAQGTSDGKPGHEGMPHAAIATGIVDLVVPVEQIAEQIMKLGARRGAAAEGGAESAPKDALAAVRLDICAVLRRQVGHDFSDYKERPSCAGSSAGCRSSASIHTPMSSGCTTTRPK